MPQAVIFLHIPKTAGISFMQVLQGRFGQHMHPVHAIGEIMQVGGIDPADGDCCLYGHHAMGTHEYLHSDFGPAYITFMRHPLALFGSMLRYRRRTRTFFGDVQEFFERYHHNPLVQFLGDGSLQRAEERLFGDCTAYGLTEYFDRSLVHMGRQLGVQLGPAVWVNASRKTGAAAQQEEMTAQLRERVLEANRLDLELYERAERRFLELEVPPEQVQAPCDSGSVEDVAPDPCASVECLPTGIANDLGVLMREAAGKSGDLLWLVQACDALRALQAHDELAELLEQAHAAWPDEFRLELARWLPEQQADRARNLLQEHCTRLEPLATRTNDSLANRHLVTATALLARLEADERAMQWCKWLARLLPENLDALLPLVVRLRRAGRHAEALERLESFAQRNRLNRPRHMGRRTWRRVQRECIVTLYEQGQREEAMSRLHTMGRMRRQAGPARSQRDMAPALPADAPVVVFNTGPALVHDALAEQLPSGVHTTLVGSAGAAARICTERYDEVVSLPEGRFVYQRDRDRVPEGLVRRTSSSPSPVVIVLMSRHDPVAYADIIKLAREMLPCRLLYYSLDAAFANEGPSPLHPPIPLTGEDHV